MILKWTDSQKVTLIRMISFDAIGGSDSKRGAGLALIHRITFKSKDELNDPQFQAGLIDWLPRGVNSLNDLAHDN